MVIAICGSMEFANRMLTVARELEAKGHTVLCPEDTESLAQHAVPRTLRARQKKERELIKKHYLKIKASDAILVLNFNKQGKPGWIGANTFLEIGFAHVLGRKIYLLNPPPDNPYIRDEIMSIEVETLLGSLDNIPSRA
jgi:hypothetical protein